MNDAIYYIGQAAGILVTIGAVVNLQLKKKQHMYILSIIVNILSALNILLLGGFSSGVLICLVADIQIAMAIWHDKKQTQARLPEQIIFLALYVVYRFIRNNQLSLLTEKTLRLRNVPRK